MRPPLEAAAFDIDGTLYPNWRFYAVFAAFALRRPRFLLAFAKARYKMRDADAADFQSGASGEEDAHIIEDFYARQAREMAALLKKPESDVYDLVDTLIYKGWPPLFKNTPLYPHVRETLDAMKSRGLRLGILSDFPAKEKLALMGFPDGYFDAVLCSEEAGKLKPDRAGFDALSRALGVKPASCLYVGNSRRCDIRGAKAAGFKSALIRPKFALNRTTAGADFVFSDYRQLLAYIAQP